ncbi:hypothetical protein MSAN_00279200 [Mycena sanguinolenta]|uniref:Transmembrane protein n=1 Tax=Mycena sanguinolenta TaxID=230812 RepID=A0A8H6ZLB0_9AGAR|nr:hypothetical protein MSAN_00279200 [Mycena sanguinolenta]
MSTIFRQVRSFRLGYAEQRRTLLWVSSHALVGLPRLRSAYPWKWTTSIVLCFFFLISPLLAALNVPLSAYNVVQEVTYRPNDTLPPLPLSPLLPRIFQDPASSFTPQVLTIGDVIVLNGSIFNYTLVQAFDGPHKATSVSSFSYYNNPFSDNCDVTNMTINLMLSPPPPGTLDGIATFAAQMRFSGIVTCRTPTLFYLSWSGLPNGVVDFQYNTEQLGRGFRDIPLLMNSDLYDIFATWTGPTPSFRNQTFSSITISFTVKPCCDCDAALAGKAQRNDIALATSLFFEPTRFHRGRRLVIDQTPDWLPTGSTTVADILARSPLGNVSLSVLEDIYQNLFQSVYHLVRLDLGVILGNQMYNSSEMYNRTITDVPLISYGTNSSAHTSRVWVSDPETQAQWQYDTLGIRFFGYSDRVPVMEYLRPVPRIKPLGSALTSVFVSTFAMISVLWTIFSVIAGALAGARTVHDVNRRNESTLGKFRNSSSELQNGMAVMEEVDASQVTLLGHDRELNAAWQTTLERLSMNVDTNNIALERMKFLLRKRGLWEDEDDNEKEMKNTQRQAESRPEISIPLMHRISKMSDGDSVV